MSSGVEEKCGEQVKDTPEEAISWFWEERSGSGSNREAEEGEGEGEEGLGGKAKEVCVGDGGGEDGVPCRNKKNFMSTIALTATFYITLTFFYNM